MVLVNNQGLRSVQRPERNYNIELFRCLCMFGVVCIHTFAYGGVCSHHCYVLSYPSLIGFVMISGWFGIHFRPIKLLRLFSMVVFCSLLMALIIGEGGISLSICCGKNYWYVWAYIFVMILSPFVDHFCEKSLERKCIVSAFIYVGIMLWGWSFLAQNIPLYFPTVVGFTDLSGVILLLVYIESRLICRLGFDQWLMRHAKITVLMLLISILFVFCGFRHCNSIFAFAYAFSTLILLNKVHIGKRFGRFLVCISPSMFSVYLLHMPLCKFFSSWVGTIEFVAPIPHALAQFFLAIIIYTGCLMIDLPRRCLICAVHSWIHKLNISCKLRKLSDLVR